MLAVLIIVALGPLATVAWKLIDINREALKTQQQVYQLLLARSIAAEVDIQVEGFLTQLTHLSRALAPAARRQGSVRQREIQKVLSDVANDRLVYLRYINLQGKTIDWSDSASVPRELDPLFITMLRKTAEAVTESPDAAEDSAAISEPFLLPGNPQRAALVISAPVVSRGVFRGVLAALVDLDAVSTAVIQRHTTGHTVFILDRSGTPLATSDPEQVRTGQDVHEMAIVSRYLTGGGRTSETMPFVLQESGREVRYIGSYELTNEGWGVFVLAKQRHVYHPISEMMSSTLSWALAALGLAILAAVFFAGTLSKPMNRLAAASRAFAAGDFSTRVKVRTRNEIGELADVFNRMADKIEDDLRKMKKAADENNELFLGTIRALAQAIDAKDPYTRGHSVRVNKYSVLLARYMGLPERDVRDIHVASLLHDVGKIGINDSILQKPGTLTPDEFATMKTHTTLGASIMQPIRQMTKIIPGLRSHHERMNGSGYPEGLHADQIPMMARIIAVADTFDAMTTHRPYQTAMTFDAAQARINELKTVALDSKVVEAFNRAYQAGEFQPEDQEVVVPDESETATA
jgi:HD-GYP domain-containing protein (c-di-GMP phosphodiesterase class II)